ncbi:response regulator transcription factor [Dactylosporangium matsuzakiense]|uniref:DNA-binding response regulator n=1 Tax=Dactylosporangium matsuzakiense TaxID=53360 RepID=A0A9W6NNM2_9ACTN|nr:response regulator transcription factor [Dactylosporangium matsuzakiense]UWZ48129.1 response regulator transcription factor [Dactylosporangium matsuzakiense]GLL03147.1 DNA-binding response regulator [Dactylosporangium matsuzakiense]
MRVVLAEDLYLLRTGIERMLHSYGFEVVAAVDTGPDLLEALLTHRPDVAVVDVRLPPTNTDEGLRAALTARERIPGLPVLILSQYVQQLYARELLAGGGGVGYLLKDRVSDTDEFVDALRRVAAGGTAVDPDVIAQLLAPGRAPAGLTGRELDVLALMAQGLSNAVIGKRLFLSEGSVSKYTTQIFTKLGLDASPDTHRRVLAVLAYLEHKPG